MKRLFSVSTILCIAFCLFFSSVQAMAALPEEDENVVIAPEKFQSLEYRMIGPNRGGRSPAVVGVPGDPFTYYMGTSGGGLWKTSDAGMTWTNISDGFFEAGSIGAIAIAPSDKNVIYAGTGETNPRGDIQTGLGLYKSTDAGKTWSKTDLISAGNIGKIRVHPDDPDLVYVAVLGHLFGPNEERGVYRSMDGGTTWEKILYVSDRAGAVDLAVNPDNPRILFAAIWQYVRKPWTQISGGEDSGLYKSVDGGGTWTEITEGIPEGIKGKIGVTISPANPDRVWASIEADDGGIFRSDDGGKTWVRINKDRELRTRPFYYSTIFADPVNEDTLYVCNVRLHKSIDGGKSFKTIRVPHGDTHDLWINPDDNRILINGNDGGACVSFNGGESWSTQMNQPTAEFYRVTTDNQFPYRVYGAQQDNSTISVSSRRMYLLGRGAADIYAVGGGEQGHIRVDPRDSNIVYAGNYDGFISRYDHRLGLSRNIKAWPEMGVGLAAKDYKYRFQMNAPIRINPHNPDVIYHCSNYVHRSSNEGKTWEIISPDLTRNDPSKQVEPGGPITKDQAGGPENYCTIFAFEHSPLKEGLLWAGSDDGLVHISHDNGATWENITPPDMPEWATVNEIELSPHNPAKAYLAVQRYRLDDFNPYIFLTEDYGKTWRQIARNNGIPVNHFVRVVREDPAREGLLYAGTEFGMYISFDDGAHWQKFQHNLPAVQIADLVIKDNDLVVATHGRSFWILDDLTPLHQLLDDTKRGGNFLFKPRDAYNTLGTTIHYYIAEIPEEEIVFDVTSHDGKLVRTLKVEKKALEKMKAGANKIDWNLRYEEVELDENFKLWGFNAGPLAVPGEYTVTMKIGEWSDSKTFTILADPRLPTTEKQYTAQLELSLDIMNSIDELLDAVNTVRDVRGQLDSAVERAEKAGFADNLKSAADSINEKLGAIEQELIQTKLEASQDILNYPPKLLHQFFRLLNTIYMTEIGPLDSSYERFEELEALLQPHLDKLKEVLDIDIPSFNSEVDSLGIPAVVAGDK